RFHDYRGDVAPIADPALGRLETRKIALLTVLSRETRCALRRDRKAIIVRDRRKGEFLMMREKAQAALRCQRSSIITSGKPHNPSPPGVGLGEPERKFIRLGAGRKKDRLL